MKKVFTIALLLCLALPGCGLAVKKMVSDKFALFNPYTVAILPVKFTETEAGGNVNALFRKMTFERLKRMNYGPLEPAEVDRRLEAAGGAHGDTAVRAPLEVARLMGSDAVLYTTITEWKSDIVVRYAYLKVNAVFELYSKDGTLLWQATHGIKESDVRLERMALELAVIKAYEPIMQRFINIVFSTLPTGTTRPEEKTFFKWLP